MVYKAELIGILLALYLLSSLSSQPTGTTLIGLDNQVAIHALNNQKSKLSHYLLDHLLMASNDLHVKQDKLMNTADLCKAKHQGNQLVARTKGVIDPRVQWIPGHKDFEPNEKANVQVKRATKGDSSPTTDLPKSL